MDELSNSHAPLIPHLMSEMHVSGALINAQGIIIEVNEGWKAIADGAHFGLKNYGVGENYLKYCVYPDPQSLDIVRGLTQVLMGKIDSFATFYPCGKMKDAPDWFLMAAFPNVDLKASAFVVHFDVTKLLKGTQSPSISMVGLGPAAIDQTNVTLLTFVRRALQDVLPHRDEHTSIDAVKFPEMRKIRSLTEHQIAILGYLGIGASNAAIAKARGISVSAAKAQCAALIRKLGFENRVQAALFAARHGVKHR